jgi:hypothetical protein
MKKLLLIIWFCLVPLICIAGCSKPDKPAAEKIAVINKDSIFVNKYLPEIRDAFCAETLTVQYLKKLFNGKSLKFRYGEEFYIDSTNSGIRVGVYLDNDSTLSGIRINFPEDLWQKEQIVPIFGQYTDSHVFKYKVKDGTPFDFLFRKKCKSAISVTGWLNVCGSLRSVHMFYDNK